MLKMEILIQLKTQIAQKWVFLCQNKNLLTNILEQQWCKE